MKIQATQLREGTIVLYQNELYRITDVQHVTPGNWRGMVQVKMKKLAGGTNMAHRFRSTDTVEKVNLETRMMQYLYSDATGNHFMDNENYDQIVLTNDLIDDAVKYLTPNLNVQIELYDGAPVNLTLPITVDLKIVDTEPSMKGASVSGGYKPATMETGLTVQVPPFVQKDETIRIDTRTGAYVERVSS
jgi:elongation factor P